MLPKLYRTAAQLALGLLIAIMLGACASQQTLAPVPADASPELEGLYEQFRVAGDSAIPLFAPVAWRTAQKGYDRARDAQPESRQGWIKEAETLLERARSSAASQEAQLQSVSDARSRALAVKAATVEPAVFAELESRLKGLALQLESGEIVDNGEISRLATEYAGLELRGLKYDIIEEVRQAIRRARDENVDEFAPRTLNLAERQMLEAVRTLEQDRTQQTLAREQAANAFAQTGHARELKEQVQRFENEDASVEDILLWHEEWVAQAFAPMLPETVVRLPPPDTVRASLEALLMDLQNTQSENARLQLALDDSRKQTEQLQRQADETLQMTRREMEQQVLSARLEADAARREQAALRERVAKVRDLFAPTEASVFGEGDSVIIRAHGFEFAPGRTDIATVNLPLVSKIISAVDLFPRSAIRITGHTDSMGEESLNQKLSEQRAGSLARMLSDIGSIDAALLKATGAGESSPVESNDTPFGRAANRRVEIEIDFHPAAR